MTAKRSIFRCAFLATCLAWPAAGLFQPASAQPVDLELVLAIDASTSVDRQEFILQRQGLSQAFRHPDVIGAIHAAGDLGIAVAVVQWAGGRDQHVSVEWSHLRGAEDARSFAARIAAAPRRIEGMTDIAEAVKFSVRALQTNTFEGRRLVIDVSGDGTGSAARAAAARDLAVAAGIVVNGLVIANEDIDLGELALIDLRTHYARFVIGGSGAFLMNAMDFTDFRIAIRRKLVREITGPATAGLAGEAFAWRP